MTARRPPQISASTKAPRSRLSAASPSSWMALVAATTLGLSNIQYVRTTVASLGVAPGLQGGSCRLIVQSYAKGSITSDHIADDAKPLASAQRSVTNEELALGVHIDLVHVDAASSDEAPLVVAWLEQGEPDLEFDGRRARPGEGALFGHQQATRGGSSLVLLRQPAASA